MLGCWLCLNLCFSGWRWGLGLGGCVLERGLGRELLQRGDGSHALGREHAPALQLPVLVLLQQHRTHQGVIAASLGKMPTTRVRRLISSLTRSSRLVLQTFLQCWSGKWRKASTSSLASIMSSAALGKRSASELARSSPRASISAAVAWANTERSAAVTMP